MEKQDILIYPTDNGYEQIEVIFFKNTFWTTQQQISQLYQVDQSVISKHIKKILEKHEYTTDIPTITIQTTAKDNKQYDIKFYHLELIIQIGNHVNTVQAKEFRKWSANILEQYIRKGFVINEPLLKNGSQFGQDYFDELLEKIKEIRVSERRFYQKVTDIFAQCSYDYNKNSKTAQNFYSEIQNKLHYAITHSTAPELIYNRVNHKKNHMGLKSWKNSPDGKILKSDVTIAKNYLTRDELTELNTLVTMFLDYAELTAKRHELLGMKDWAENLNSFIKFNAYELLENKGSITKELADKKAIKDYDLYREIQDQNFYSDFDKIAEETMNKYD